jgi:hypothetical protein
LGCGCCRYRSQRGGSILHIADRNGSSLRIGLEVEVESEPNSSVVVVVVDGVRWAERFPRALNGEWQTLLLALEPDAPHPTLSLEGVERKGAPLPPNFLKALLTSPAPEVILGSWLGTEGRTSYEIQAESRDHSHAHPESLHEDFFRGCLGEVSLGQYRLPFLSPLQLLAANPANHSLVQTTAPTAFYMDNPSPAPLSLGCLLCYDNECQNGGQCQDPTQLYDCACPMGYTGRLCQVSPSCKIPVPTCQFEFVLAPSRPCPDSQ